MKGETTMMKKITTLILAAVAGIALMSMTASADADKGQKIILKKLKKACGFNGGELAKKHTQVEWKTIQDGGKLNEELSKLCPGAKPLKDKYVVHVYDFVHNYASDSGNVPS
jgi:hypothetical protein